MFSALLLVASVVVTSGQTIEGFTIPIEATWGAPKVDGETTVMDGNRVKQIQGKDAVTVMHSVRVTDLSSYDPIPDNGQVFEAHETEMRSLPRMAAQNLRRSHAKFGDHDVLVLSGSAKVLDGADKTKGAFVFSMAFIANGKAYEFSQVSVFQDALDEAIAALPRFTIREGAKDLPLTGGPADLKGEYTIAEVPFAVTLATAPHADVASNALGYVIAYSASDLEPPVGPQYDYQLRRLNADESRPDNELFWDIARQQLNTETAFNKPELFVVKNGGGTVDAEYNLGSMQHVRFRYARSGDWVAVLAVRTSSVKKLDLTQFDLKVAE